MTSIHRAALTCNVMTFNVRHDTPHDGPNAWPHRKEMVARVFAEHAIDLAGLQEPRINQMRDLEALLPDHAFIGVGRNDGKEAGEFSPIFYRREKFDVEEHGTFWLSPTPEAVGSKGWDAAVERVATWGIFREKASSQRVFFINTHLDHRGETARRHSASLLVGRIAALGKGLPVVLTGDFNLEEDSPVYRALLDDPTYPLADSRHASRTAPVGGGQTFNGFGNDEGIHVIDFIFVGPGIVVDRHGFFPETQGRVYVSDHWPVVSRLLIGR